MPEKRQTKRVTTVELSKDDIRDAVIMWARAEKILGPEEEGKVVVDIGTRTVGYGMGERDEPYAEVSLRIER